MARVYCISTDIDLRPRGHPEDGVGPEPDLVGAEVRGGFLEEAPSKLKSEPQPGGGLLQQLWR